MSALAEVTAKEAASMATEAAQMAEAAHRRRLTIEDLTGADEVRRYQWLELDSPLLQDVRRKCWRLLPHNEAEDLAAEVLTRELEAAKAANRPGCVRAERLTTAYLKWSAKEWHTRREAVRLSQLADSDESGDLETLADESAPVGADVDADSDESEDLPEVFTLYRRTAEVARRVSLPATRPVIAALATALSGMKAADLAADWGVSLPTWRLAVSTGRAELRASYPDLSLLARRIVGIDREVVRRATALPARRLGEALPDDPEVSHHRTAGQMAREADWLLARPQLPGRKPHASKASAPDLREPKQPADWRLTLPGPEYPLPAAVWTWPKEAARALARALDKSPRSGRPAHSQYRPPMVTPPVFSAPKAKPYGWALTYPEGAACDLNAKPRQWVGVKPSRPLLPTWQEGAARRPRTSPRSYPTPSAASLAAETGAWLTWRERWRLAFMPTTAKAGALAAGRITPCSLDMSAGTEHRDTGHDGDDLRAATAEH